MEREINTVFIQDGLIYTYDNWGRKYNWLFSGSSGKTVTNKLFKDEYRYTLAVL